MRLYLVRHGEAKPEQEDPKRPLADSGVEDTRRIARFLTGTGSVAVSEIRHSTKLRARQTAEILAQELGLYVPIREIPGLEPLDDVAPITEALSAQTEDLMLVGHLPHLARLASRLVAGMPRLEAFACRRPACFAWSADRRTRRPEALIEKERGPWRGCSCRRYFPPPRTRSRESAAPGSPSPGWDAKIGPSGSAGSRDLRSRQDPD